MAFAGLLRRVWIPLVALALLGFGGFTVSRVRADVGSQQRAAYPNSQLSEPQRVAGP
jgi:hypothetical protein